LLSRVPLGQAPSLHRLRGRLLSFVRRLPRYYGPVRLPTAVHHRIAALAFPMRPAAPSPREQPWDLPVPVHGGSAHAEGLRPRGVPRELALAPPAVWPSALFNSVGTPKPMISRLNTSPARTPVNASPPSLRTTTHDSGPSWVATPSTYGSCTHSSMPVSRRTKQPITSTDGRLAGRTTRPGDSPGDQQNAGPERGQDPHWQRHQRGRRDGLGAALIAILKIIG
jgi:hypothetical protein